MGIPYQLCEAPEGPLCLVTSLANAVLDEDLAETTTVASHAGLWGLAKANGRC